MKITHRFFALACCTVRSGWRAMIAALFLGTMWSGCSSGKRTAISLRTELEALATLDHFARPAQGKSDMISTFDRRGGNMDWWTVPPPFDGGELYEAAFLTGPGCVKRIWMTNIPATEWLFYFDGAETPALTIPQRELFGGIAEWKPVCDSVTGGAYCYLPFPYASSLRIVLRIPKRDPANERMYFHIGYETYAPGTLVESWTEEGFKAATDVLENCVATWKNSAGAATEALNRVSWTSHLLPAGGTAVFYDEKGPGTLRTVALRLQPEKEDAVQEALLNRLVSLEVYWDGQKRPAVLAPVGDFFCNGLQRREFAAMPMAAVEGALVCRLPMPFKRHAKMLLRNESPGTIRVDAGVERENAVAADALYLHACFDQSVATGTPFEVFSTRGRGKFIGTYMLSLGRDGSWNILEGDESFYRDDDAGAVHHGTGLEDYFNGGWYYFGLCERPLHGLLEKAAMRTAQYRFHLTDPVTFEKHLRMQMEFGADNMAGGYLSATSFWYQEKPVSVGRTLPPPERRYPDLDQVAVSASLCELFELERVGLTDAARRRSDFYAAALQTSPLSWFYRLRSLAYREMQEGHAAVREAILALAEDGEAPEAVQRQARLLLWRGEKPYRGIFGAHAFAECKLFADGKPVGAANGPLRWEAFGVELPPGEHLLELEVTAGHEQAFLSAGYSSFSTNIISDISWDYRAVSDGDEADGGEWRPVSSSPGYFPTMAWWQFEPNGFPCVQSGVQQGGPCADWAKPPGRTWRLRRRLVVPQSDGDRPPSPARVLQVTGRPVRPADDTSNMQLQ